MAEIIRHDINALEKALDEGVIRLVFLKLDGDWRTANATRCPDNMPDDYKPKGTKSAPFSVLPFFDVDKQEWRCLRKDRLVGYIELE